MSPHRSLRAVITLLLAAALVIGCAPPGMDTIRGVDTATGETTTSTAPGPGSGSTTSTTGTTPGIGTTSSTSATTTTTLPDAPLDGLAYETIVDGLTQPVFLTAPPGDERLFVIEKPGRILLFDEDGTRFEEPFLDIRTLVESDVIEQGLLGMTFHPGYDDNGRFFVYYTDVEGDSTLAEYLVDDTDPDRADPGSARILLTVEQPDVRHNAGMLAFDPAGLLYVAFGDGGAGASRNSQDPSTLLGSILRLDVDGGDPYAIPPDNPFVDGGGAPEVWLYGLRNPWRFSIDPADELLYIGDVGQAVWEEVDIVPLDEGGLNFGWHLAEGLGCFGDSGCDPSDFAEPAVAYTHEEGGCSVTGGYVYRGGAIPELAGHYFYTDWCRGWIKTFRFENGAVTDEQDWSDDLTRIGSIDSFGLDGSGELYVTTFEGLVARIVPVRG